LTAQEFLDRRKGLGLTQAQMAQRLGISQEMVSQIESGKKEVPISIAEKLNRP
jgi:transcriptional regulator with XRE-family HTH domain